MHLPLILTHQMPFAPKTTQIVSPPQPLQFAVALKTHHNRTHFITYKTKSFKQKHQTIRPIPTLPHSLLLITIDQNLWSFSISMFCLQKYYEQKQ